MLANFTPKYTITPKIALCLMRIEASRGKVPRSQSTSSSDLKGYEIALTKAKEWAVNCGSTISDKMIPTLHALMMADGQSKIRPSSFRQGPVSDAPETQQVPGLTKALVDWINTQTSSIPCPIIAAIALHQCTVIQSFDEGNSSFAKLLTTLILHLGGYDIEFNPPKIDKDLNKFIDDFVDVMAVSYENAIKEINPVVKLDKQELLRELNLRQRKAIKLFKGFATVSASQIGDQFDLKPRTRAQLCKDWVDAGFLEVVDNSNKARKYKLTGKFEALI